MDYSKVGMQGSSPICRIAGVGSRDPSPIGYILAIPSYPNI